jgi:hypothetical protein
MQHGLFEDVRTAVFANDVKDKDEAAAEAIVAGVFADQSPGATQFKKYHYVSANILLWV